MAKPGIIYRLNWQAFHETTDVQCYVDISDNDNLIDDADEATVYDLEPAEVPAVLSVINNDEDPFSVILAQQLTIRFINNSNYNMTTFASGSDQRWSVHYYIDTDTNTVFKGFVSMEDISEPLLPPYEVVTLTANDNLALLKDQPLTKSDDTVPVGEYKIIDLLELCLSKTGLDLEYRVAFNIKHSGDNTDISTPNSTNEHFFSRTILDIISYQDETNTLIDCYSIIERILGHEARLFQMKGQWWIVRIDEIEDATRGLYISEFDSDGAFVSNLGELTFDKTIDENLSIYLSQEASVVRQTRPHKSVRLDFKYEQPIIPYNANFELGVLSSTISSTEKRYNVSGWFLAKAFPSGATPFVAPTSITYIKRIFDTYGQESERYVVITCPTVQSALTNKLVSQPVKAKEGDRFTVSVDFRFSADISGTTRYYNILNVVFLQDDGTWWLHGRDETGNTAKSIWYDTSNWSANTNKGQMYFDFDLNDDSEWNGQTTEVEPLPGDGKLYIWLNSLNTSGGSDDDLDIHYNNLSVDYHPFIKGSYQEIQGQYHSAYQANPTNGVYKAKIKEEVFVSDCPKPIIKGTLEKTDSNDTIYSGSVDFATGASLSISGFHVHEFQVGQILIITGTSNNNITTRVTEVNYLLLLTSTQIIVEDATVAETASCTISSPAIILSDGFYNAAVYPTGPPSSDYIHPYGHIQLFDVWNQYKREMKLIEYTFQGLDLELQDADSLPDTLHLISKISCTDGSPHLDNKRFIQLYFNQNHDNQESTGVIREVIDTTTNKDYSNHEFKYIEK